jgi:cytidine deaminase
VPMFKERCLGAWCLVDGRRYDSKSQATRLSETTHSSLKTTDDQFMENGPLDPLVEKLRTVAAKAAANAWCPYSRFSVGAAIETEDGSIFAGCNVENASSGLSVCAERNAIFQAVANGHRSIRRLVVYTPTEQPTTPCGACRQVLSEFGANAEVVCVCDGPDSIRSTLTALLPMGFGAGHLVPPSDQQTSGH